MYSKTISRTVSAVTPLVAAIALALPASAQDFALEEVVVTAQKRAQSLMDVPLSVSAVSGAKMQEAGIMDLADLTAYVPNFQKSDASIGSFLVIRGIGSGINQGFEQSVVQYVDDIALGRAPLARMPFLDLNRVEVLRGPQNVLFGKNSIAGALSMVTNKPTDEFEGSMQVEYEPDYESSTANLVLSGPISDTLRGRLAVRHYNDDGYFDNNLNDKDEASREDVTARGIVAWDITDTLEATLKVEHTSFDMDGRNDEMSFTYTNRDATSPFYGTTYPQAAELIGQMVGQDIGSDDAKQNYKRNTNINESSNVDTDNVTLAVNWEAEQFSVTSITGYLGYETDEDLDTDGAGIDAFTQKQEENYDQYSQEIRFTSPGGETIDWIGGAYYQYWDLDYKADFLVDDENLWSALGVLGTAIGNPGYAALGTLTNLQSVRDYSGDSETWAAFGQMTWNISDVYRLTLGARYTSEEKTGSREMNVYDTTTGELNIVQGATAKAVFGTDFANLGEATGGLFPIHRLDEKRGEEFFTPAAIFEWDVTNETMLYTSVSTGAKAGGFDARGNTAENMEYGDETVLAYELGAKSTLLDERLELNVAAFYSEYDDLQVSQFDGTLGFVVGNAAQATTQGVELDGRWLLAQGLTWSFAAAYLDFEFDDYDGAACSAKITLETGAKLCDYSGERNIYTPEWNASSSMDFITGLTANIDFHATVDVMYTDDQFVDVTLNPDVEQEAYTRVNARLALETDKWSLAVVGKNLTDEDITTFATDTPLSGTLGAPAYTSYMERPRTIAVQALYRF
jgi:iron complex outermembrane receptor protein